MSDTTRRTILTALMLAAWNGIADAQSTSLTSVAGVGTSANAPACDARDTPINGVVSAGVRTDWPLVTASADAWALPGGELGAGRVAHVALFSPQWRGWRSQLAWGTALGRSACARPVHSRQIDGSVSYALGNTLVWVGRSDIRNSGAQWTVAPATSDTGRSAMRQRLGPVVSAWSLGSARSFARARVAFSLGSRAQLRETARSVANIVQVAESTYNDTIGTYVHYTASHTTYDVRRTSLHDHSIDGEIRIDWSWSRFTLGGSLGQAFNPPAGSSPSRWGDVQLDAAVSPLLTVVGHLGSSRVASAFDPTPRRYTTLGIQWSSAPFARPARDPVPTTAAVSAFRMRVDSGAIILGVRAPLARLVEVTGDFLGWEPARMSRTSAEWWELRVRVPSGVHRVNVRVDGARWMAPLGLLARRDEFGGEAGILVVP